MKKLYSLAHELLVIRTLCSGNKNPASNYIFSRIDKSHFASEIGIQTFDRIMTKFRQSGEIPDWRLVVSDPGISQEIRGHLENKRDIEPITSKKLSVKSIRRLDDYKKQRVLVEVGKKIEKAFRSSEGIDTDQLIQETQNALNGSAKRSGLKLLRIGGPKSNMKGVLRKVLRGEGMTVIPTGFKGFDTINRGLPLKSVLLLGGPTGGGKSALVGQLVRNMAKTGARVGVWGLEMTPEQMFTRDISSVSNTKGTDFLDAKTRISPGRRREIEAILEGWEEEIDRANGELIYLADEEENPVTMAQLLAASKPYAFDVVVVDYVGLLEQTDQEQHRSLGDALKVAKKWADANNCIVIVCAQVDKDMNVRYARQMEEHAPIAWKWKWDADAKLHGVTEINQSKARYVAPVPFSLKFDFQYMSVRDATDEEIEGTKKKSEASKNRWAKKKDGEEDEDDDWVKEESEGPPEKQTKKRNRNEKTREL